MPRCCRTWQRVARIQGQSLTFWADPSQIPYCQVSEAGTDNCHGLDGQTDALPWLRQCCRMVTDSTEQQGREKAAHAQGRHNKTLSR